FLVESVDTPVSRFGKVRSRYRALPVGTRRAHVLLAHADVEKLLPGSGGRARGLGLRDFGLDFRAVERHQQVSGLHVIALADVQLGDAPDDLGGTVEVAGVGLPLLR